MWNTRNLAVIVILFATSLALTAWQAHGKGKRSGMDKVQALWTAERMATTIAQAEEAAKARQTEQALQAALTKQRMEHRNEINRIARKHTALVHSLQQRAQRPDSLASVPQSATAGIEPATGCTGAQLYRQDGEFLAREAARADQLRLALKTCISDRAQIELQLN
jgi:hypothetical protein